MTSWLKEHYELGWDRETGGYRRCLRCGMDVWHLTKHAVNDHGDDIEIEPVSSNHVAAGMLSDEHGRLVLVDSA